MDTKKGLHMKKKIISKTSFLIKIGGGIGFACPLLEETDDLRAAPTKWASNKNSPYQESLRSQPLSALLRGFRAASGRSDLPVPSWGKPMTFAQHPRSGHLITKHPIARVS